MAHQLTRRESRRRSLLRLQTEEEVKEMEDQQKYRDFVTDQYQHNDNAFSKDAIMWNKMVAPSTKLANSFNQWFRTPVQKKRENRIRMIRSMLIFFSVVNITILALQLSPGDVFFHHLVAWRAAVISSNSIPVSASAGGFIDGTFEVGLGIRGLSMTIESEATRYKWFPVERIVQSTTSISFRGCCTFFVDWERRYDGLELLRNQEGGVMAMQWVMTMFSNADTGYGWEYFSNTRYLYQLVPYTIFCMVVTLVLIIARSWKFAGNAASITTLLFLVSLLYWEYATPANHVLSVSGEKLEFKTGIGQWLFTFAGASTLIIAVVSYTLERFEVMLRATTPHKEKFIEIKTLFEKCNLDAGGRVSGTDAINIINTVRANSPNKPKDRRLSSGRRDSHSSSFLAPGTSTEPDMVQISQAMHLSFQDVYELATNDTQIVGDHAMMM